MKIRLKLPEAAADYVRHARFETLKALGEETRAELLEPAPFGMYLLAYGAEQDHPLGMAEFTFYDQVYPSFAGSPYPDSFGLEKIGAFESFVGTRTVYVEPEARAQVPSYYLMLAMAGSRFAYGCGARFTTASTNAADGYLMRLYEKTGGKLVGTYRDQSQAPFEIAVFVFDLEQLVNHPAMRRLERKVEIDPQIAQTIRSRRAWDRGLKCA